MSEFNPDKIFNSMVEAGEDWADKQAAADLLEETRKTVLARFINQIENGSMAARESLALADPGYGLHLVNMVNARHEANRARVNYDARKVLAELRRTEQSTRRAEMTLR